MNHRDLRHTYLRYGVRIDREGRVHDEHGRFSPVLWEAQDRAGRRITLTEVALRHARGEEEPGREPRHYLTSDLVREAVATGDRYRDEMPARERLVATGIGPSRRLVVVVEIDAGAGTVVTAHAMRRVPSVWSKL